MVDRNFKLAVLIDADNVSEKVLEKLFSKIAKIGEVAVKRIYGDFTSSNNARWKNILHQYAIKPISQFSYTTGKNATDGALIIDAMDLLHTHHFDGFCIVSSDSDFTGLAIRIKEEGLKVYGFGAKKTPEAFRNACNQFTVLDPFEKSDAASNHGSSSDTNGSDQIQAANQPADLAADIPYGLIQKAIEDSCDDSGFANLGAVGNHLLRIKPDFDPRLYAKHATLSSLLRERSDLFEIKGNRNTLSVKLKTP